jgi:hypothetical protein
VGNALPRGDDLVSVGGDRSAQRLDETIVARKASVVVVGVGDGEEVPAGIAGEDARSGQDGVLGVELKSWAVDVVAEIVSNVDGSGRASESARRVAGDGEAVVRSPPVAPELRKVEANGRRESLGGGEGKAEL